MEFYSDVVSRLKDLGFDSSDNDKAAIAYYIRFAAETVKLNTNLHEVPDGLRHILIDMAAGLFLRGLKDSGRLTAGDFDFSAAVTRITEGDVSVEFAQSGELSPEARFDRLIASLICPTQNVYGAFRRLKW